MSKEELEKAYRNLILIVNQECCHLRALKEISIIKDNHNVLASLDLSIFKLWEVTNKSEAKQ